MSGGTALEPMVDRCSPKTAGETDICLFPMGEFDSAVYDEERFNKEAPQLTAVLKEMKEGLDIVRDRIQALTAKVKAGKFPTSEGISYLEAKHLLLLSYCQSLVYYLLSKAKGLSIQSHPVVRSLVEIRLFLEKIRPIDKKLQYQIQKLTRTTMEPDSSVKKADESQKTDDLLKYRPNPDLIISKENPTAGNSAGLFRPSKFIPVAMEEDKMSRQERNALRRDKQLLRQAEQNPYYRDFINDLEGRPEEIRETIGTESREMMKFISKMEERARKEEDLFTRAPLTKLEKKKLKQLKKPGNGLLDVTENFYDDIKGLHGGDAEKSTSFKDARGGNRKFKKHKR